jgi:hypothetical protein
MEASDKIQRSFGFELLGSLGSPLKAHDDLDIEERGGEGALLRAKKLARLENRDTKPSAEPFALDLRALEPGDSAEVFAAPDEGEVIPGPNKAEGELLDQKVVSHEEDPASLVHDARDELEDMEDQSDIKDPATPPAHPKAASFPQDLGPMDGGKEYHSKS